MARLSIEQPTVALIDDDPEILRIFARFLRSSHSCLRILEGMSGQDCYRLFESEQIDLLLLDLLMPDIDGFMILHRLKTIARTATVPVVVVTVLEDPSTRARARLLGAQEYITKPVSRDQLQRVVNRHLPRPVPWPAQRPHKQEGTKPQSSRKPA